MYELGLAHAAKKPVIMLAQEEQDVPFDVRHVRYLKYNEKDLTRLKSDLTDRIINTLSMERLQQPDYFPELIPMSIDETQELRYLRARMPDLTITTYPPTSDIFFNDKLLGQSPQTVKINPDAPANWVSISSVEYFEYHGEIDRQQAMKGTLGIVLEPREKSLHVRRVPGYLRERRKYPNNPVLMRAIASYLWSVGEFEEAIAESRELVGIAPHWAHAHNQMGFVLPKTQEYYDDLIRHYETTLALQPHGYIGLYNLACTFSIMQDGEECLAYLERVLDSANALRSYCFLPKPPIGGDSDFDYMRTSERYAQRFRELDQKLTREWEAFASVRQEELRKVEASRP